MKFNYNFLNNYVGNEMDMDLYIFSKLKFIIN